MSHQSQRAFIDSISKRFPNNFKQVRVLEIGSLNINGSVRDFFSDCEYTGVDIGPGPGVDVVYEGQKFPGDDRYYDTVISAECFEHNPYWFETFFNMWRMLKPGGLFVFTCATEGRQVHGTAQEDPKASPLTVAKNWNYYRNLTKEDFSPLKLDWFFEQHEFSNNLHPWYDLYFWGIKRTKE